MAIKPFRTVSAFLAENPLMNHSSRVFSKLPPVRLAVYVYDAFLRDIGGVAVYVADAFIRDIGGMAASVADAIIQDVPEGPVLGLSGTSLSYASTTIGSTRDLTLVLTNVGTTDLEITSLTPTGDFTVTSITA